MLMKKGQRRYEGQAEVVSALVHPIGIAIGIAIVNLLKDGEYCVCDIAEQVGAERLRKEGLIGNSESVA